MKKIILIIFWIIVSIIGIKDIEATIVRKSTKENVPSSLSNFSDKLDKTYIYNTDKFNCSASGCTSYSDFNSRVGLLSSNEYEIVLDNSSYFVLDNNSIKEMTPNGINEETEESAVRASIYLKKGVKVTGSGSVNDPYTVIKILTINVENGTSNLNVINLNRRDDIDLTITPNVDYTLENANISCDKGANITLNKNTGILRISNILESQTCSVHLEQDTYTVTLANLSHVSATVTEKRGKKHGEVTFELTADSNYSFERTPQVLSCSNATASINESGILTVSNIEGNSECTISLSLTQWGVTISSIAHGSLGTNESSTKITEHGGSTTFQLNHDSYYEYDNNYIICTNSNWDINSSGMLTVSGVTGNASCSVDFKKTSHTVTVSVTNGSSNKTNETVEHGTNATFTITPNSTYTLSGANISCSNGNGVLNNSTLTVSGLTSNSNCSVILNRVQTLVSFDANEGSGGQSTSKTATYGSAMPSISTTAPTKTGHTFAGWYDQKSGGTKYYNANGTSARNWDKTTSTATLYAHWTVNTTVISFDANGGSGGQSTSKTATYGSAMPSISTTAPTKTGHTFAGWYDQASGGTKYYNANGTSARNWDKTSSTATLYAHFTVIENYKEVIYSFGSIYSSNVSSGFTIPGAEEILLVTTDVGDVTYTVQNNTSKIQQTIRLNLSGASRTNEDIYVTIWNNDVPTEVLSHGGYIYHVTVGYLESKQCPKGGTLTNDSSKGTICVDMAETYCARECSSSNVEGVPDGCEGTATNYKCGCCSIKSYDCDSGWNNYTGSKFSGTLKCYYLAGQEY